MPDDNDRAPTRFEHAIIYDDTPLPWWKRWLSIIPHFRRKFDPIIMTVDFGEFAKDQMPLGADFEAVWDENAMFLYDHDEGENDEK